MLTPPCQYPWFIHSIHIVVHLHLERIHALSSLKHRMSLNQLTSKVNNSILSHRLVETVNELDFVVR